MTMTPEYAQELKDNAESKEMVAFLAGDTPSANPDRVYFIAGLNMVSVDRSVGFKEGDAKYIAALPSITDGYIEQEGFMNIMNNVIVAKDKQIDELKTHVNQLRSHIAYGNSPAEKEGDAERYRITSEEMVKWQGDTINRTQNCYKQVRAEERERCAKEVEQLHEDWGDDMHIVNGVVENAVEAIRNIEEV